MIATVIFIVKNGQYPLFIKIYSNLPDWRKLLVSILTDLFRYFAGVVPVHVLKA